jgi:cell division protein FtsA
MIKNIAVGIDVGTHTTRVVVCEFVKGENTPRILGMGYSPSKGLRHGYVTNTGDAAKSIRRAVADAEKASGIKIKRAYVSIGGISLESASGAGSAVVSRADGEVTALDVSKALTESEESLKIPNKKIIHAIPTLYKLDGKEIHGRPEGMKGVKLEIKTLFITCLEQHLEDLIAAAGEAGIDIIDVIASPLAESLVVLNEKQKAAGCILVDIGAETVSIAVFENGAAQALHVFSIGSTDITNDIALGLKIPLEEAEGLKIGSIIRDYPKKKLDQIIEARLSDVFELIENYLKKIKRNGLLPAGVVMTGGGSNISMIEDLSRDFLKLPSKIGAAEIFSSAKGKIRDSSWFVALGLTMAQKDFSEAYPSSVGAGLRSVKNFFKSITDQLLP